MWRLRNCGNPWIFWRLKLKSWRYSFLDNFVCLTPTPEEFFNRTFWFSKKIYIFLIPPLSLCFHSKTLIKNSYEGGLRFQTYSWKLFNGFIVKEIIVMLTHLNLEMTCVLNTLEKGNASRRWLVTRENKTQVFPCFQSVACIQASFIRYLIHLLTMLSPQNCNFSIQAGRKANTYCHQLCL